MSKVYMIGEWNGKKYVAHMDKHSAAALDNSREITKAEYRCHRAAGVSSWGEEQAAMDKALHHDPMRARRWAVRAANACAEVRELEQERLRDWKLRQIKALLERK